MKGTMNREPTGGGDAMAGFFNDFAWLTNLKSERRPKCVQRSLFDM